MIASNRVQLVFDMVRSMGALLQKLPRSHQEVAKGQLTEG